MHSIKIEIKSRDYWFKVVDFLQQNWALIDESEHGGCIVFFVQDASGVFDRMEFASTEQAETALRRNGFAKYSGDKEAQKFIAPPAPPFAERAHPNGPIYSSGIYWR